jgi:hypothetical protein
MRKVCRTSLRPRPGEYQSLCRSAEMGRETDRAIRFYACRRGNAPVPRILEERRSHHRLHQESNKVLGRPTAKERRGIAEVEHIFSHQFSGGQFERTSSAEVPANNTGQKRREAAHAILPPFYTHCRHLLERFSSESFPVVVELRLVNLRLENRAAGSGTSNSHRVRRES